MKITIKLFVIMLMIALQSCTQEKKNNIVYKTETLVIEQITPTVFKHVSYLQTNDFGNVPCNGMVYITNNKALVFDTPTTNEVSEELISWITTNKKAKVSGVVVNHFHDDCLGGLKGFHDENITSYASDLTIELATKDSLTVPQNGFDQRLDLMLGSHKVSTHFLGEGHTKDNTVSYLENEHVLFGGCMVKSLKASKGYLGDANIEQWSNTVANVKAMLPNVTIVIPGHGKVGDVSLLDYTIQLFKK
jgi:metallo-beta-lactamase class B